MFKPSGVLNVTLVEEQFELFLFCIIYVQNMYCIQIKVCEQNIS